jgi:hypothetical protein
MAIATKMKVEECLRTNFRSDREFVRGELLVRNAGKEIEIPLSEIFK